MQNIFDSHKTKGLIIGIVLSITSFILYTLGGYKGARDNSSILLFIMFGLAAIGGLLFARTAPKQYTFGNVFAHGFKTAVVGILVMIAYVLLDEWVIHPNLKQEALSYAKQEMDAVKDMSDAIKDKQLEAFSKNYMYAKVGVLLIFFGIAGAFGSLIGALVSPRKD
jgi:hypothetical protein